MSFADRLVLWLHIGFAIFAIGPVALAISSTPRCIRRRDVPVLRYLTRITMIFTAGSLLVLVFGVVLGQLDHDFSRPWLTVAMTLFVVAIVLLVLIVRDQRRAIKALAPGEVQPAAGTAHDPDDSARGAGGAEPGEPDAGDPETEPGGGSGVAAGHLSGRRYAGGPRRLDRTRPDRRDGRCGELDLAGHTCVDGVAAVGLNAARVHGQDFSFL